MPRFSIGKRDECYVFVSHDIDSSRSLDRCGEEETEERKRRRGEKIMGLIINNSESAQQGPY